MEDQKFEEQIIDGKKWVIKKIEGYGEFHPAHYSDSADCWIDSYRINYYLIKDVNNKVGLSIGSSDDKGIQYLNNLIEPKYSRISLNKLDAKNEHAQYPIVDTYSIKTENTVGLIIKDKVIFQPVYEGDILVFDKQVEISLRGQLREERLYNTFIILKDNKITHLSYICDYHDGRIHSISKRILQEPVPKLMINFTKAIPNYDLFDFIEYRISEQQGDKIIEIENGILKNQLFKPHAEDLLYCRIEKSKTKIMNKTRGCFVATEVYGNTNHPNVCLLREYRDEVISKSWYGQLLIILYYATSPLCVIIIGKNKLLKKFCVKILNVVIEKIKKHYTFL